MKIGLVSPYDLSHPGGVTEHVAHLAAEFQRADHEVHVIAPFSRTEPELDGVARIHAIGRAMPVPANGSVARISLSLTLARSVKRLLDDEQFD